MDGRITRSSAIAEGPRDVSCQLKSCQLSRNSAETTCTTSPEQIEVMKLERCIASRGKNLTRKEPKTKKTIQLATVTVKSRGVSCISPESGSEFSLRENGENGWTEKTARRTFQNLTETELLYRMRRRRVQPERSHDLVRRRARESIIRSIGRLRA